MRLFLVSLSLFGASPAAFSAYQQQLIPIIRDIKTSSAPSVTEWKTFVRMATYEGSGYVSLVQVAELLNGHLRWYPVSKRVDLSVHNQIVRFAYDAPQVWINGRRHFLEHPTVKNDDGFWVPISFFASTPFYQATQARFDWPPRAAVVSVKKKVEKKTPDDRALESKPVESVPAVSTVPPSTTKDLRAIRRIVIDPGHGGKDPGTVGAHGIEEKTVNLQLAQQLAESLRQDHQYDVILTRTDDTFIPLAERARLANTQNADIFVSIHCNASLSSKLKGFEVYFLSENASDPHADAVARLENSPLALEGKQVPSPNQVAAVLRSLVKTAYINEASELGSLVDHHLGERLSEPSLGVKQAGFYVLRGAEMPAILIETGFLSNAKEERLLQDESFRKKLIDGIVAGIVAYDERKQKERR